MGPYHNIPTLIHATLPVLGERWYWGMPSLANLVSIIQDGIIDPVHEKMVFPMRNSKTATTIPREIEATHIKFYVVGKERMPLLHGMDLDCMFYFKLQEVPPQNVLQRVTLTTCKPDLHNSSRLYRAVALDIEQYMGSASW